jgi:hypothetical protein
VEDGRAMRWRLSRSQVHGYMRGNGARWWR